jgi:hypothetical protein
MEKLEAAKKTYELDSFTSDGCSGNVSRNWQSVVEKISEASESFANAYANAQNVPFEYACVEHDKAYHAGKGGYVGRLKADNQLRSEIISYGINNASDIQSRAGLGTPEEAIFLYELLAEAVYGGVRLGGGPCTGKPYAWGYGFGEGHCQ